jgi:ATP-dependent helicase/nuclease subunit A
MTDDKAARARALDTASSFLVQAPAGSGKTELLIQRYMKLLAIVETPDSVVAITFTRKAAAEMRGRVLVALRNAQSGSAPDQEHEVTTFQIARAVLDHDRCLGWNLLDNPAQMRIETIDALCASITRRMPWLARFGAMPEIIENAEALYREAARNTLRHADEENQALATLLLHLDNDFNQAERLLVEMIQKRDQWLRHTGATSVRADLEASIERLIRHRLEELRAAVPPDVADQIAALLALDQFPGARAEDLPLWNAVAELLLTKDGTWRIRADRGQERVLARLQSGEFPRESLNAVRKLPSPQFSDPQWSTMQAAVSVLKLAVAELQLVFRERGRVDFAELALRASEALGHLDSPTDLALALGQRMQHILVDEFQDTSFTQFELLQKLTMGWEQGDGRTLFLVGDPMQSIYRFREADVSLLLKARQEGIGSIRLEPLTLTANFRSRPEIVSWVNEIFRHVLPPKDDIDLGAVSYAASHAALTESGGTVEIHASLDAQGEAERILELVRPATGGTTAILVRARAHLAVIVNALKQSRIPFQAIEIDQLGRRPVVEDLLALTFALLHPGDRVSWLAVLRAPWCGLTLADLHALASAGPNSAIWDVLHRRDVLLSNDGAARISRILSELERSIAQRGRRPLRDWIESAWLRLGGPACTDETGLKDAAAFFDLLEGIDQGSGLDDFQWLREQVNELFAQTDVRADGRLQLMTIHKAKGLEFDTVILPRLGERSGWDPNRLLIWLEQGGELLLAPIKESGSDSDPIYKYVSGLESRKAEHENERLLYVAATRARRNLHLLGTVKRKDDGSIAEPQAGTFLKLLWPLLSAAFSNVARIAEAEPQPAARMIRRVPADWRLPASPPPVTHQPARIETSEPLPVEWTGDRWRHAGTALHALFQRIAREGLESWNEKRIHSYRHLYRRVLANLGVAPADLSATCERVETGLLSTLRDPRGRWILSPHPEAESERPLAGLIAGKLTEAVLDRTFVDEQGVRWIIDYKTSDYTGGDLEAFLDSEKLRYQEQLEHYARLLFQQDQRPIRLALYFPLLGGWREWPAPVVLRRQASLFEL